MTTPDQVADESASPNSAKQGMSIDYEYPPQDSRKGLHSVDFTSDLGDPVKMR